MTTYVFLSPEWIAAAIELRDRHIEGAPDVDLEIRINLRVTETPFGTDVVGYVDSTAGLAVEEGTIDGADIDLALPYDIAFEIFATRDPQVMMQAFFGGKIRAEGDVAMLLALQAPPADTDTGAVRSIFDEVIAFTEGVD